MRVWAALPPEFHFSGNGVNQALPVEVYSFNIDSCNSDGLIAA